MTALVLRVSDAGRWELGAGVAAGWRPLFAAWSSRSVTRSVMFWTRGSGFSADEAEHAKLDRYADHIIA